MSAASFRALVFLPVVACALALGAETLPSVDAPLAVGMANPGDRALVIGVEHYDALTVAPHAAADATAFAAMLRTTRAMSGTGQVLTVMEGQATRSGILQALRALSTATSGTVWVYFSGHGVAHPGCDGADPVVESCDPGRRNDRLLLPVEVRPDAASIRQNGISVDDVRRIAGAGGATVMIVTDACYTGSGRDGTALTSTKLAMFAEEAGPAEWSAARPGETARPLPGAGHGAFTWALLGAARGWADGADGSAPDRKITLGEANVFAKRALEAMGIFDQTPELKPGAGLSEGTVLVAAQAGVPWEVTPTLAPLSPPTPKDPTPTTPAPAPRMAVIGGSAPLDDLDRQLVEQECEVKKFEVAKAKAGRDAASQAATVQAGFAARWAELRKREAGALSLPTVEARAPMIAAVEAFLADARSAAVTRSAGVVSVSVVLRPSATLNQDVDCGTRMVALPEARTAVAIGEVAAAEALLSVLKASAPTALVRTDSGGGTQQDVIGSESRSALGGLSIVAVDVDDEIYLDDKLVGYGRWQGDVPINSYRIRVGDVIRRAEVSPGATLHVDLPRGAIWARPVHRGLLVSGWILGAIGASVGVGTAVVAQGRPFGFGDSQIDTQYRAFNTAGWSVAILGGTLGTLGAVFEGRSARVVRVEGQ